MPKKMSEKLQIAIGSDHAGFGYKQILLEKLRKEGYAIKDLGTYSEEPYDYPDIARAMGEQIQSEQVDKGILICGSGIGVNVAVNKFKNVRAGICHDAYSAHQGVEHDDMNVLCIGQRIIGIELAQEIIHNFLEARFSAEDRHQRRLNKVLTIEKEQLK